MTIKIIGQIIGIIASIIGVSSLQFKKAKVIIAMQLVSTFLFSASYLIRGMFTGALANFFGAGRAVVYYNREKLKADRLFWVFIINFFFLTVYGMTFLLFGTEFTVRNAIIEAFPIIGMWIQTIGFYLNTGKGIRIANLSSSPCWLTYNICTKSIGGMISDIFCFLSAIVGMVRHDIKRNKKEIGSNEKVQ